MDSQGWDNVNLISTICCKRKVKSSHIDDILKIIVITSSHRYSRYHSRDAQLPRRRFRQKKPSELSHILSSGDIGSSFGETFKASLLDRLDTGFLCFLNALSSPHVKLMITAKSCFCFHPHQHQRWRPVIHAGASQRSLLSLGRRMQDSKHRCSNHSYCTTILCHIKPSINNEKLPLT